MEGCMSSMLGNGPVEYSKGFEQLLKEHEDLRQQLNELLEIVQSLNHQNEKAEHFALLIEKVGAFFKVLEIHSEKEETVLFPMLETYIGKSGGPIAVMEYEHEQAKYLIQSFLKKEASSKSDEEMLIDAKLVSEAHALLISHFMKEENVLFPMGEQLFSENEKEEFFVKITK